MIQREEVQERILSGIDQLAVATQAQRDALIADALANHAYRQAQASERIRIAGLEGKRTVDHVTAMVDQACDIPMLKHRLAEAEAAAADSLVRSLRAQLSAAQSILSANKAEADAVRYGQIAGA